MREKIDYYFSLISPWAYLGHATFMELAATNGLDVTFKPIFLQSVFDETGGLVLAKRHPARQNYRWFELQRWRDKRALPLTLKPRYFPCDPRLADKTAIALITAGHDPDAFIRAAFSAVWSEDRNIADPAVLAEMLAEMLDRAGYPSAPILAAAAGPDAEAIYARNAEEAIAANVIGSPCYVRRGEVFWGQDRLDLLADAITSGRAPFSIL